MDLDPGLKQSPRLRHAHLALYHHSILDDLVNSLARRALELTPHRRQLDHHTVIPLLPCPTTTATATFQNSLIARRIQLDDAVFGF